MQLEGTEQSKLVIDGEGSSESLSRSESTDSTSIARHKSSQISVQVSMVRILDARGGEMQMVYGRS